MSTKDIEYLKRLGREVFSQDRYPCAFAVQEKHIDITHEDLADTWTLFKGREVATNGFNESIDYLMKELFEAGDFKALEKLKEVSNSKEDTKLAEFVNKNSWEYATIAYYPTMERWLNTDYFFIVEKEAIDYVRGNEDMRVRLVSLCRSNVLLGLIDTLCRLGGDR